MFLPSSAAGPLNAADWPKRTESPKTPSDSGVDAWPADSVTASDVVEVVVSGRSETLPGVHPAAINASRASTPSAGETLRRVAVIIPVAA